MISKKLLAALNEQITHEIFSSLLYLQMSAWLGEQSLTVFQEFFVTHTAEERLHATKLINYLLDRGEHVQIGAMPAPDHQYASLLELTEKTLEHEKFITKKIHDLMQLAQKENDYATEGFLKWYVDEQVEEEAVFSELVSLTRLAKDNLLVLEQRVEKLQAKKSTASRTSVQTGE